MNYYSLLTFDFFSQNELSYSEYYYTNIYIKVIFIIFLIYFNSSYETGQRLTLDIDNHYNITEYEQNIDFSNYSTDIKTIALYLPRFQNISERFRGLKIILNEWKNINITTLTSNTSYHYPRVPGDEEGYLGYYDTRYEKMVKKQVDLAKSHGIYGFGIFYYWFSGKKFLDETIDLFLESKKIKFPFFLIWRNEDYRRRFLGFENDVFLVQKYNLNNIDKFVNDIKKYLISPKYIKIQNKPIVGIYDPSSIPEIKTFLVKLREEARKQEIGEIYILAPSERIPRMVVNFIDGAFDMNPREYYKYRYSKENEQFYYSSSLIFHTKLKNKKYENYTLFRGNVIEYDSSHTTNESIIYDEYSPEKFYESNKVLLDFTKNNYPKDNQFYFLNGWNNWLEGSYLEPDTNYGYAAINSFSKALYNLPYNSSKKYNFEEFEKNVKIAVQAHVYYENLIKDIINKINNIPFKFDLYISTNTYEKKNIIEKYVKGNTKANYYEIMVIENKGRDLLPMLIQMKHRISNYEYFCHIHSKTSNFTEFGKAWREYLYYNLLGNEKIIKDIMNDFIQNKEIGFIYPEVFYKLTKMPFMSAKDTNIYLNYIINKIIPGYKVGDKFKYSLGNMFWAKVDAIKQAFTNKYVNMLKRNDAEKEYKLTSYANEIAWLYFVKINGYYYKSIFKGI